MARRGSRRWALVAALTLTGVTAAVVVGAGAASASPAPQPASRYGLGLVRVKPRSVSQRTIRALHAAAAGGDLPASVDLTAGAAPVGNQGQVGSCAAWATDYTALGYWLRADDRARGYLEPMYTYSQVQVGNDGGSTIDANLLVAQSQGVDMQSDYPQGNFDWRDQPTAGERANAVDWKLGSFQELPVVAGQTVTQLGIEEALAAGTPVTIGFPVYANFESLGSADDGYYASPSGALLGGHAVTALGYDPAGLVIENSWTTGWADGGFATLSWSFVNQYVWEAVAVGNLTAAVAPVVATVTPASVNGDGGTQITVTGAGLYGATIAIGGQPAPINRQSAAGLVATTPPHAAAGTTLTVTTPNGETAGTAFTYTAATPPTISRLTPARAGAPGGTQITVTGTGLYSATVQIGGRAATIISRSATTIVATVPPHPAGAVRLTVTTFDDAVAGAPFTYTS